MVKGSKCNYIPNISKTERDLYYRESDIEETLSYHIESYRIMNV